LNELKTLLDGIREITKKFFLGDSVAHLIFFCKKLIKWISFVVVVLMYVAATIYLKQRIHCNKSIDLINAFTGKQTHNRGWQYDASFHHIFFSKPFDVLKISQNTHCSPTVCMI